VWTTDKDGLILGLLAAEICARTQKDPGQFYQAATTDLGTSFYQRIDVPASPEQKKKLASLQPEQFTATRLAGEAIEAKVTRAPGNNASIGGLKVVAKNGWFAVRPSGTENVLKLYAESFLGAEHLKTIQQEAQSVLTL